MATNHLALLAAWHGIDAPALRKVLRDLAKYLKDGGTSERSLGVEGLGVFYSQSQPARYCVRDGKVYSRPACRVVKLRPAKQTVTELTDLRDLKIETNITDLGDRDFTLLANQPYWTCGQGSGIPVNEYRLYRSPTQPRRYALVLSGITPADVFTYQQDLGVNEAGDFVEYFRWDSMLLTLPNATLVSDYHVTEQIFRSSPRVGEPGTPAVLYDGSGTLNKEVLARYRAVTIGVA